MARWKDDEPLREAGQVPCRWRSPLERGVRPQCGCRCGGGFALDSLLALEAAGVLDCFHVAGNKLTAVRTSDCLPPAIEAGDTTPQTVNIENGRSVVAANVALGYVWRAFLPPVIALLVHRLAERDSLVSIQRLTASRASYQFLVKEA